MLIRFSVENFRSLREKQELSLVASRAYRGAAEDSVALERIGVRLLPVAAIYGANASGKTNVIRALDFMAGAVLSSQRAWSPVGPVPFEPFLLDADSAARPSKFEVDFAVNEVRFTYGFELTADQVESEWLFAYPNGKRQLWFERDANSPSEFRFGKNLSGEKQAIQNLTRRNSLFLSAAAQNAHAQLLPVQQWFDRHLTVLNPSRRSTGRYSTIEMLQDQGTKAALLSFLAAADLGIVDADVNEIEVDENYQRAMREFLKKVAGIDDVDDVRTRKEVRLRHKARGGSSVALEFDDESDGTMALFSLSGPVLTALRTGGVLVVDELDASLHPVLVEHVVRSFEDKSVNRNGAQLVFNTHDTTLLTQGALARDQVWFTEKDAEGATQLYPLSDFRPRKQENIARGYLSGRYGAVPFTETFVTAVTDGK